MAVLSATCLACKDTSDSSLFYDCVLFDGHAQLSGTVNASISSWNRCTAAVIDGYTYLTFFETNAPNWQYGDLLSVNWLPEGPGSQTLDLQGYSNTTTGVDYVDNAKPRDEYQSLGGGTVTIGDNEPSGTEGVEQTISLDIEDGQLSAGVQLQLTAAVQIIPWKQNCAQASSNLQALGCFGLSGSSASDVQSECLSMLYGPVAYAGCVEEFTALTACAVTAASCSACGTQYCALNTCMCKVIPVNGTTCQSSCPF